MSFKINSKTELENFIIENWQNVNEYICEKSQGLPIPVYSSVDIRESKNKYAPVDHNMYPAGFNNVCKMDLKHCTEHFKQYFLKISPSAKSIAIIPESHTKNLFYLDHLHYLKNTIAEGGFDVKIISFDEELFKETSSLKLVSQSQFEINIDKASLNNGIINLNGQAFDLVLLNHDQSNPIQINWDEVKTPVIPSPKIGWFRRQKIEHFKFYKQVADDFSNHFGINPNLIQAQFKAVYDIDFNTKQGLEELGKAVDDLKTQVNDPSLQIFVKASQGTYGMGISVVGSGEEIINMNRKIRNKMDIGKNNIKFTSVLVQEGIETVVKYDDMPAEITIYLVNGKALGGFMRANPLRSTTENLNAKGMIYQKLCICDICKESEHKCKEAVYSVIARLSTLASAYEIKNVL